MLQDNIPWEPFVAQISVEAENLGRAYLQKQRPFWWFLNFLHMKSSYTR
jgi:hypothetical protein